MILFVAGVAVGILLSCVVARRAADKLVKQAEGWRDEVIRLRGDCETLRNEAYKVKKDNERLNTSNAEQRKEIAELSDLRSELIHRLRELTGDE